MSYDELQREAETYFQLKPESMRLGIALPLTRDSCETTFLDTFVRMRKPAFTYLRPRMPCAAPIDKVRNGLVFQALESDCTHILMMDTDQSYPPDTIDRLVHHAENGLDIVGLRVHRRYPPFDPLLLKRAPAHANYTYETMPMAEWSGKELVEVDATGCGCLLINLQVFERIEPPWFELHTDQPDHGAVRSVGEDVYFCEKAKAAGFRIFVDVSMEVGHIASMLVTKELHALYCMIEATRTKSAESK